MEICEDCKYYQEGHCTKDRRTIKCRPSSKEWFDEDEQYINGEFTSINRMCEESSIYGNCYLSLTPEILSRLQNGEILHFGCEEYGVFIRIKNEQE